jgi:hypothetical protein
MTSRASRINGPWGALSHTTTFGGGARSSKSANPGPIVNTARTGSFPSAATIRSSTGT